MSIKLVYPAANPRTFSDDEQPFLISDTAALTAKSEKGFSTSEMARITLLPA